MSLRQPAILAAEVVGQGSRLIAGDEEGTRA
jgi:hypothetical protein